MLATIHKLDEERFDLAAKLAASESALARAREAIRADETPEERWCRMREWVREALAEEKKT